MADIFQLSATDQGRNEMMRIAEEWEGQNIYTEQTALRDAERERRVHSLSGGAHEAISPALAPELMEESKSGSQKSEMIDFSILDKIFAEIQNLEEDQKSILDSGLSSLKLGSGMKQEEEYNALNEEQKQQIDDYLKVLHPPRSDDRTRTELIALIDDIIQNGGENKLPLGEKIVPSLLESEQEAINELRRIADEMSFVDMNQTPDAVNIVAGARNRTEDIINIFRKIQQETWE